MSPSSSSQSFRLRSARVPLGAPGIYPLPEVERPSLHPQRMDVCAFVGVAPRGPAYVPVVDARYPPGYRMVTDVNRPVRRSVAVRVDSFDAYRQLYGGFEGPGHLPYAVASYFQQGGRSAVVVRVVASGPDSGRPGVPVEALGRAKGEIHEIFTRTLDFVARNAGTWGNDLRIEMGFKTFALSFALEGARFLVGTALPEGMAVGAVLRLTDAAGRAELLRCVDLVRVPDASMPVSRWQVIFDAVPAHTPVTAELVEAWITIRDGAGSSESFDRLGLAPDHPRGLASVLCCESALVWPGSSWAGDELMPMRAEVELALASSGPFLGGEDDYGRIVFDDFFDVSWTPAGTEAGGGVTALVESREVTQVVVPDLYVPALWKDVEPETEVRPDTAGARFSPCVAIAPPVTARVVAPSALVHLILDPRTTSGREAVAALQQRVVEFCELTQDCIALLDVPPGLSQSQAERWRAGFDSSWSAAYHPWLLTSPRDLSHGREEDATRRGVPPSAVAAGIVARKERQFGLQYGPANERVREIVSLAEVQPPGRIDALHPLGLNGFTRATDGIYLVAARTLSRDSRWRQLSVRRLVLMLRRTLLAETQWAVFEPNGPRLWANLEHAIECLLRRFFQVGAFAGATPAESYFVRLVRDARSLDQGRLIVEIGVAPAEPLEFILLRLTRDGDGTLTLES